MKYPSNDAQLWDSCRALIDDSRRARAARQARWDALLDDRERMRGFEITFLTEASARLIAEGQERSRNEPPTV